jgi:hypothetical protein
MAFETKFISILIFLKMKKMEEIGNNKEENGIYDNKIIIYKIFVTKI